jgi:hypothetical protein
MFQKRAKVYIILFQGGIRSKRIRKPLKEPGIEIPREPVIDPLSPFLTRHRPGFRKKAHVAGGGGRSDVEKFRDFTKT